jgi:hypothetical protein
MPQRKFFVATEILLFDFELFIGARLQKQKGLVPAAYGLYYLSWHI